MSSFSYPPPPPPPTASSQLPAHFSNNRGRGNHRGGRGRGRGNARGGGFTDGFNRQAYPAVGNQPQQYHQPGFAPPSSYPQWQPPTQYNPSQSSPAANAYGAHGYGYQASFQSPAQYPYSAAPARPTPATIPQNTYSAGAIPPPFPQSIAPPPTNFPPFGAGPYRMGFNDGHGRPPAFHGQKRKRDAPKPNLPKVKKEVAPAVPSFGANLSLPPKPPTPVQQSFKSKKKKNKNKRRKTNQLGLTPKVEDQDEETDEDIDEEERFADLNDSGNTSGLVYNGNGSVVALDTPEAIKAWIAERKRRYPTQANIAAKATLAALAPKPQKKEDVKGEKEYGDNEEKVALVKYESDDEDDEDIDGDGDKRSDVGSATMSSESGSAPEQRSTKAQEGTEGVQGSQKGEKENFTERPFCQSWLKYGSCTWKNCKFKHRQPGVTDSKANSDYALQKQRQHRKKLYRKFIETQSLQRHEVALNVIKYLGQTGFPETT